VDKEIREKLVAKDQVRRFNRYVEVNASLSCKAFQPTGPNLLIRNRKPAAFRIRIACALRHVASVPAAARVCPEAGGC